MSRWQRLWKAIKTWWKNEYPPETDLTFLQDARKLLAQYNDLYTRRIGLSVQDMNYASQAAEIVLQQGLKRAPTLEGEVRTLAIVVERLVGHLEQERQRQ